MSEYIGRGWRYVNIGVFVCACLVIVSMPKLESGVGDTCGHHFEEVLYCANYMLVCIRDGNRHTNAPTDAHE